MKLGAEPKKIAILGGLLLVAIVMLYMNVFSGDSGEPSLPSPAARPASPGASPQPKTGSAQSRVARRATEFRPSLKGPADEPLDPSKIDPTLHLEILAKLQTVTVSGPGRNIFEFGAPPPPPAPKTPEPKIIPTTASVEPPKAPEPPKPPTAPPIPLKFYGFTSTPRGAEKRGFFLDGEEIVVATEGETIKRRYKVIRIGLNTVEVEDLQFSQKQTLRLEEQPGGVG